MCKGNTEKSRKCGGRGQGKQPWGVGRYAYYTIYVHCTTVEPPNSGCVGNFDDVPYSEVEP